MDDIQKAQLSEESTTSDCISRRAAQNEIMYKCEWFKLERESHEKGVVEWCGALIGLKDAMDAIRNLPSVQPEPLSDAYMKAVLAWLLDYQIKTAELKGRYTPYEVLSWVVNDWRKEHEGFD